MTSKRGKGPSRSERADRVVAPAGQTARGRRAGEQRTEASSERGAGSPPAPDPPTDTRELARTDSRRAALCELVNELPEGGLAAAIRYLTLLRDDPVFVAT
jgi:hypothetical protein